MKIISTKTDLELAMTKKVGDNVMLTNHTEYKYETPYRGPFVITQCFTNGMVNL